MKKYFKMSDFIVGDASMSMNHNGDVSVQYDYADPDMIVRKTMDAMEHAINSHDELVAMNKELLAALEGMLKVSVMDMVSSDDFWRTFNRANELLAKAKAAS